jgi:acetate kinase
VHGGDHFDEPVIVDDGVVAAIEAIAELAPLHNRLGLMGIRAARAAFGGHLPQVAVFDTAFHRSMPPAASTYGGPYEWIGRGYKKYGFHGISHQYAGEQAALLLGRPPEETRLVTCHLGGGCSVTAISGGRSVDTSMGFTPLEGLMMVTRSGSVDPALVLHLLRRGTMVDELEDTLENRSGLLGLSGISDDLRQVIAARDRGHERATLAIDVFVHRAAAGVGAMIASLGGLDALVFTGGIGEHSAEIRERIAQPFAFIGAPLLVVPAREELAICRAVRRVTLP